MISVFLTQNNSFILGPISKVLGYILEAIYNVLARVGIENVAICIIIFTIIINAILIPLNYKSQKSSRLTQIISPELNKITEKYKGKRDEASPRKQPAERQALSAQPGSSPASGCLPLLITMPILFAMYRVLYAIPAYITSVRDLYSGIADRIIATPGYMNMLRDTFGTQVATTTFKWADTALTQNQAIDLLAKFSSQHWTALKDLFPAISGMIGENAAKIMKINSFLGMDITQAPGLRIPHIIIPILSGLTQWLSQKTLTGNQTKSDNETLNNVNNSMKYMWVLSLVIGFSLPIGVGLYWIVGAVFRTVQQMIINKRMDRLDMDELIEKNREKAAAKRAKREKRDANLEKYSQQSTRTIERKTISDYAKNTSGASENSDKEPKKTQDTGNKSRKDVSSGSISAIAHMLDRD